MSVPLYSSYIIDIERLMLMHWVISSPRLYMRWACFLSYIDWTLTKVSIYKCYCFPPLIELYGLSQLGYYFVWWRGEFVEDNTAQVATIMYFSSIGVIYFNELSCLFQRIELLTSASDQGGNICTICFVECTHGFLAWASWNWPRSPSFILTWHNGLGMIEASCLADW